MRIKSERSEDEENNDEALVAVCARGANQETQPPGTSEQANNTNKESEQSGFSSP